MSILVIKSKPSDGRRLAETLSACGFPRVAVTHTLGDALTTLAAAAEAARRDEPGQVDLVMMDTHVTDMDGISACAIFKSNPGLSDIPIILLSPAHATAELARALDAGAHDYLVEPFHPQELAARVRAALRLKQEVDVRRARERELEEHLARATRTSENYNALSNQDELTKLANRRRFNDLLRLDHREAVTSGTPLAVLMLDVDHFKLYNDARGHQAGDLCLKLVAAKIRDTLRNRTDTAARYGGEEFSVILPHTTAAGARVVAERIRAGVEAMKIPHPASPTSEFVTVSIGGVGLVPPRGRSHTLLVGAADAELYAVKRSTRNSHSVVTELPDDAGAAGPNAQPGPRDRGRKR